jgi:hypothetical protein
MHGDVVTEMTAVRRYLSLGFLAFTGGLIAA